MSIRSNKNYYSFLNARKIFFKRFFSKCCLFEKKRSKGICLRNRDAKITFSREDKKK